MREQFASLAQRLDEFSSVIKGFTEIMAFSEKQVDQQLGAGEPSPIRVWEKRPAEPVLTYRLCLLLDFLRDLYGFDQTGVFVYDRADDHLKSLVLSPKPGEEAALGKFENQVQALWESGDVKPAVEQKKREIIPREKEGTFLVIPFRVTDDTDGFWATHFDRDILPGTKSSGDMILWMELISSCIESSHLRKLVASEDWRRSERMGEERLYTITRLCRALTHEINNPLQVILGRTQLLKMNQRKPGDTGGSGKILDAMEGSANRICSLLKDFSDHLHRQSRHGTDRGEVNLLHILKSDVSLVRYLLNLDKIELRLDLEEHLPCVCGNPGELETVFLSLIWELENRLSSGGEISVQTSTDGNSVCLHLKCAQKGRQAGQPACPVDLESSDRIKMVAGILRGCGGELEFGECSPGLASLCLRFRMLQDDEPKPEAIQELKG